MHVRTGQPALVKALTTVARAVSPRNISPVLSSISLAAQGQQLTLRATDLEATIEATAPAQVLQEGAIVLPARHLTDLVRRIPSGEIDLGVDAHKFTATLRWEKSQYTIHGFAPDQFPALPDRDGETVIALQQAALRQMLRQTAFAAATEETRPYLMGVHFTRRGETLQALATNGARIAVSTGRCSGGISATIPRKALQEVQRLLVDGEDAEVQVTFTASHAFFTLPAVRVISRLLEGQYPDVMRLVPQTYQTRVHLGRQAFIDACGRAALLTKDGAIRIDIGSDALTITASGAEVGQGREELPASLHGPALEIDFNARYLIEGLQVMDSTEVSFELNTNRAPCRIRSTEGGDYTYIVLPLIQY